MTTEQKQSLSELKKKLCVTETYCPCFSGFYGTLLSDIMEIQEFDLFNDYDSVNGDILNFVIDKANCTYFNYKKCKIDISKRVVEYFNEQLKDNDLMVKFKFKNLYSPKEYNYDTDSINIKAVYTTDFIRFLNDYVHKYQNEFKEFIKDRYTSHSGFISFYSNDYNDWFGYLNKETLTDDENGHYLGTFLDFYFENEDENITENIYNYVFEKMCCNSSITNYLDYDKLIDAINKKFNLNITELSELENLTL